MSVLLSTKPLKQPRLTTKVRSNCWSKRSTAFPLYKNNPPAFLQGKQEPGEDEAPDATFTDANKSKGENQGIVAILTMLKEDLEAEITNGIKSEGDAHADRGPRSA